jgi:predicted RNA-binding protein with TRAM domain
MNTQLEEGSTHDVVVLDKSSKGDFIAKIEGMVVFLDRKDIKSKDRVKIEITNVKEKFAFAKVIKKYDKDEEKIEEKKPEDTLFNEELDSEDF